MNRTAKAAIMALTLLFVPAGLHAQTTNASYFMEGSKSRHQLNPAFAPTRNYIALPAIGGSYVGTGSNIALSSFLFETGDGYTTFLDESVGSQDFLSRIESDNMLALDANVNLLSAGFRAMGGYNTIELSANSNTAFSLPSELFEFMKTLGDRTSFSIPRMDASMSSYFQLALGHSHAISDRVDFGAKLKFLVGAGSMDIRVENINMSVSGETVNVDGYGTATFAGPLGVQFQAGDSGLSGLSTGGVGFGAAVDLGVSYELIDGVTLSAALVDLGFITYESALHAVTPGEGWTLDGMEILADGGTPADIDAQYNAIIEALSSMVQFQEDTSNENGEFDMLSATLNIGAEFKIPSYDKLSFGLLYSNRFAASFPRSEGRVFVNLHPIDWFEFSANCGFSNFGTCFGAALSMDFKGVGIFLSTDNILWNFAHGVGNLGVGLPYESLNMSLNIGMTVNFGERKCLCDLR